MLSYSDLKYSDNAIVSVTPHNKLTTYTRFYEMKIQENVRVNLLKYLYIIIHIEYMFTLKFKHNVCLEDLISYYLETFFIPSVSCICGKKCVMLILYLHVPKLLHVFQKPSLYFQPSPRFPVYSSSWNIFTVSLSMIDHICLHVVFMHNRKHLPCIIHYPLVSMVSMLSHIMGCGCV